MASKTGPAISRSGAPVTPASTTQHRPPSAKKKRMADDKAESYYRVGLIGSGNLARAIVEGLLASGILLEPVLRCSLFMSDLPSHMNKLYMYIKITFSRNYIFVITQCPNHTHSCVAWK